MNKRWLLYSLIFLIAGIILGACILSKVSKPKVIYKTTSDTVTINVPVKIDTFIHDTVTKIKYKWYPLVVYDSVFNSDTVLAEIPIEYHHYSKPDTIDIYYHGFAAELDSVKLFDKVTYITNTNYIQPSKNLIQLNVSNISTSVLYLRRVDNFYFGGGVGFTYEKKPVVSLSVGYSF